MTVHYRAGQLRLRKSPCRCFADLSKLRAQCHSKRVQTGGYP